jgi:hypothetical protein
MAVRKLSLPLFSAKPRVSQPCCSTNYFHFIATVSQKTDQHAIVCRAILGRPDGFGLPEC